LFAASRDNVLSLPTGRMVDPTASVSPTIGYRPSDRFAADDASAIAVAASPSSWSQAKAKRIFRAKIRQGPCGVCRFHPRP